MTWTVLHDACEHEDAKTVISRSKCNADEATRLDEHGSTPLHIACRSNPPVEVVRALVDAHPQGLLMRDIHGDTPLHIAVSNPATSYEVVQTLVEACPEALGIANREGLMPLHATCRYSPMNDETISLLVETFAPAVTVRIRMGDLIPRKTSPVAEHQHPVIEGSPRRGSYGSGDLRFEAHSIQTRDGSYPLHMAVSNRSSLHVLDMLINAGPEVVYWTNKYGETPLHLALRGRLDDEAVEFLLFADKNNRALEIAERRGGNLPLHLAVINGSLSIVVQLLTRFPHAICVPNSDGELPVALAKGNEHLLDILLVSDEADYQKDIDTFSKVTEDGTMSKVTDDDVVEVGSAMSVDSFG